MYGVIEHYGLPIDYVARRFARCMQQSVRSNDEYSERIVWLTISSAVEQE